MERETAMKILKELHNKSLFAERTALETIIPELKESEGEKIRKALVRFHKSTIDIDGIKGADILAWLEKQCYTKKDVDDAYLKGISDAKNELEKQGEQKPTVVDFNAKDWYVSKVDGKLHNIYQSVDKIEQKPTSDTRYEVKAGGSLSVNGEPFDYKNATITQKDFAQKPTEWSDKDEEMFQNCTGAIWAADYYLYEDKQDMEVWLKSLKNRVQPQPKQEWSEEDENYLQSAENACEYQYGKNTSTILWLKSLKNRIGG